MTSSEETSAEALCICRHGQSVHTREYAWLDGERQRTESDACTEEDCIVFARCTHFRFDREAGVLAGALAASPEERRWHELRREQRNSILNKFAALDAEAAANEASAKASSDTAFAFSDLTGVAPPNGSDSGIRLLRALSLGVLAHLARGVSCRASVRRAVDAFDAQVRDGADLPTMVRAMERDGTLAIAEVVRPLVIGGREVCAE